MNRESTLEVLKILVSSCRNIELMSQSLCDIGINIEDSAIVDVMNQLMNCVYIMFEIDEHDMAGDDVVTIMTNVELSDEQILESLIEKFGIEKLG